MHALYPPMHNWQMCRATCPRSSILGVMTAHRAHAGGVHAQLAYIQGNVSKVTEIITETIAAVVSST